MTGSNGLRRGIVAAAVSVSLSAMLAALPLPVRAAVDAEAARQVVLETFQVEVLATRAATLPDGRDVWLVKVMRRGGNSNAAFKVDTVAVDRSSGELVLGYRQGPSDDEELTERRTGAIEKRPDVVRSFTWR